MHAQQRRPVPEPWEYQAALRALARVGWTHLSEQERQAIDRWEGR